MREGGITPGTAVAVRERGAAKAGGLGAMFKRHPTAWLAGAIAVGFLLLGTSALFAGVAIGSSDAAEPGAQTAEPDPRNVPSPAPSSVPHPVVLDRRTSRRRQAR